MIGGLCHEDVKTGTNRIKRNVIATIDRKHQKRGTIVRRFLFFRSEEMHH